MNKSFIFYKNQRYIYTVSIESNCTLERKNYTLINYRYFYFIIVSLPVFKIQEKKLIHSYCQILSCTLLEW